MKLDRFINRPVLSTVISIFMVILGVIGLGKGFLGGATSVIISDGTVSKEEIEKFQQAVQSYDGDIKKLSLIHISSPEQIERLQAKIYLGNATRADITKVTKRLGDEIAAVYGFHIPKQRTAMEQAR